MDGFAWPPLGGLGPTGEGHFAKAGRRLKRSLPGDADGCRYFLDLAGQDTARTNATGADMVLSPGTRDLQNRWRPPCIWGGSASPKLASLRRSGFGWCFCCKCHDVYGTGYGCKPGLCSSSYVSDVGVFDFDTGEDCVCAWRWRVAARIYTAGGQGLPMAEEALQEYQRPTWEKSTEGRAASLDSCGNRQDARSGLADGCHRDRGGCRTAPDDTQPLEPPSWFTSWLQVISFAVSQGSELIGELASSAEQDSMLPLHPDPQLEEATVAQAQVLWVALGQIVASPNEGLMAGLYAQLREFLQMARLCPNALPRMPQGLLLAVQVTLGHILDPYSYAPSTAQEWLYPSLLLEHGGPFVGYIPPLVSAQVPVQVLATVPCPYVPMDPSLPDNNEL